MGLYGEQVLPRIINVACGLKGAAPLRRRVCEGLEGDVVEIGFGSGLNVPYYPEAVNRVAAVEPADVGWKLAKKRLRATSVPVERAGLDGQSLPFGDNSYDAALSTWTLCTIPDVPPPCPRCDAFSSPEARCTSSNTASPRTSGCVAGNIGSNLCRKGRSGAATSPGRSSSC